MRPSRRKTLLAGMVIALLIGALGLVHTFALEPGKPSAKKWEYKWVVIYRGFDATKKDDLEGLHRAAAWNSWIEDDKFLPAPVNMMQKLAELGDAGWELVTVNARSGMCAEGHVSGGTRTGTDVEGFTRDVAGFTNEEIWMFKRPKD